MMGSECGGDERIWDVVDLPVAIEPVRPMRRILRGFLRGGDRYEIGVAARAGARASRVSGSGG